MRYHELQIHSNSTCSPNIFSYNFCTLPMLPLKSCSSRLNRLSDIVLIIVLVGHIGLFQRVLFFSYLLDIHNMLQKVSIYCEEQASSNWLGIIFSLLSEWANDVESSTIIMSCSEKIIFGRSVLYVQKISFVLISITYIAWLSQVPRIATKIG